MDDGNDIEFDPQFLEDVDAQQLLAHIQQLIVQQQHAQQQQQQQPSVEEEIQQAFFKACREGDLEKVKETLAQGANINFPDYRTKRHKTGLHIAASKGHLDVVKFLVEQGANTKVTTKSTNLNALHYACMKGYLDMVKYLVDEAGMDPEENAINRLRPLHFAVLHMHLPIVEYLVGEKGVEINARTAMESTAIYLACGNKDDNTVKYLIEHGADPNISNRDGVSPLHVLVRHGYLSLVKYLVEEGNADISAPDHAGKTPLDDADMHGMSEVAIYLWQKGAEPSAKADNRTYLRCVRPLALNSPVPRGNAAIASDGKSRVFVWGGYGLKKEYPLHDPMNDPPREGMTILNDLAVLDLDKTVMGPIANMDWLQHYKNLKMGRTPDLKAPHIKLHDDGLSGEADYPPDVDPESFQLDQIIKAEAPFLKEHGFAYFEVLIIDPGTSRIVTVGLTDEGYPKESTALDKQPGWLKDSYASHSDDGCIFHNRGRGVPFVERSNPGDVIGCGISWEKEIVFFTKNGMFLGAPFRYPQSDKYWATIGIANLGAKFKVNFGAAPFKFNFHVPISKWETLEPTGDIPPPYQNPKMTYIPEANVLALFTDRLTIYDINNNVWRRLPCKGEVEGRVIQWMSLCRLRNRENIFMLYGLARVPIQRRMVLIPVLSQYDFKTAEYTQLVPAMEVNPDVDQEAHVNCKELFNYLRELRAESMMLVSGDRLCFFGVENNKVLFVNTDNFAAEFCDLKCQLYTSQRPAFVELPPDSTFTFGGYYPTNDTASNESLIINPVEGTALKPRIDGSAVPLPRDGTAAALVSITNSALTELSPEEEKIFGPCSAVVLAFGTGSCNFVGDFDLLLINNGTKADELSYNFNKEDFHDVVFKLRDNKLLYAHKVVLYCRSEYFRELLETAKDDEVLEIEVTDFDPNLFQVLVKYFYSDVVDTVALGGNYRDFANVISKYGKEHYTRILEDYLITKGTTPSIMSSSMKQALGMQKFSDVEFHVGGETIPAHKAVICSRSSYFTSMLMGNLKEAKQRVIDIQDVRPEVFRLVLEYLYSKDLDSVMQTITTVSETDGQFALDVFTLACQYNIRKLKNELEWTMASNILTDNVCSLLVLADQHAAIILKSQCLAFINANRDDVIATEDYQSLKAEVESIIASSKLQNK